MIRCPAAYNPPVVSTMAFCINDVNSGAALERGNKRRPESRPCCRAYGWPYGMMHVSQSPWAIVTFPPPSEHSAASATV